MTPVALLRFRKWGRITLPYPQDSEGGHHDDADHQRGSHSSGLTQTRQGRNQYALARRLLAIAIALGLEYGGWCPKGGWAEDHVIPPEVLVLYPKLTATPSFTVRFSIEAID